MLEPGIPHRISPRVRRLVAPNPSPMTGPGTNTYLLGEKSVAVLDPGPAIEAHIDAIEAAGGGAIRYIVCTHTHPDHSPAWQELAARTGATVIGALPGGDEHQDETFRPHIELAENTVLATDEFRLRAIYTPGHVNNHFCFLLEEEGLLFAGDHIMNGSTVVIIPPGGDMQAYIASLQKLLDYPVTAVAPGHGEVIADSQSEIRRLVEHRLAREAKVVEGLRELQGASLEALVVRVYDDVAPVLHRWAMKSLEAHLIKLQREGRAALIDGERWQLT